MLRRHFLAQSAAASLLAGAEIEVKSTSWHGRWMLPPGAQPNAFGVYHFRRVFELTSLPGKLAVHVSGDSRYQLFLNGVKVSAGPARGDLYHWRYETVDLAPQLKAGKNVLAAVVWNDGPFAAVAQWSHRTAFLLQSADSEFEFLNSGKEWRTAVNPAYQPSALPAEQRDDIAPGYYAIGPMERFDANAYPWGWQNLEFDDSVWREPELGPAGSPRDQRDAPSRWMLVERPIPQMEEVPVRLAGVRASTGVQPPAEFPARAARFTIPPNTHAEILLDQGHLVAAFPELELSGGRGARVSLRYAESLFEQVRPRTVKGNRNQVEGKQFKGYGDRYTADGARRLYRPLFWRTWRYLQLRVTTLDEPLVVEDLRAVSTGYPFQAKARLETGNPLHQQMLEVGWRTARLCAHETYMDCPYYEQLQYAGDTRIQAMVTLYMTADGRMVRNAIEQLDSSRTSEGATYSRAPSVLQQYIPPFSLWWIGMLRDYWWYADDAPFVRQMLDGVRSVLNFYQRYQGPEGLLAAMPWWNYVDWVEKWPNGTPPAEKHIMPATIHLQLLLALQWAAEMEAALGDKVLAGRNAAAAKLLAERIRTSFWAADRKLFSEDLAHKEFSQHANVLAVLAGLGGTPAEQKLLMERVESDASLYRCSVYFRYYLDRAMVHAGLGDRYLDRLGTWEFMLKEGLTTWAEVDSPTTRSDCHAWGASPNIEFFRTVLGVDSAAPGFAKVRIRPHLGKLSKASGVVPHPKGLIEVSVERSGATGYRISAKAPQGVEILKD